MPVAKYEQDSRITPSKDCVHFAARQGREREWCRVRDAWCPASDLPCMCSDYRGRDGETGRQRWPNLERKTEHARRAA